jgi:hypothetical protein
MRFLGRTKSDDDETQIARRAAAVLAKVALASVQDATTKRVRVEDYLTVLASLTGEAALVASGVIDIEASDFAPGSAIFGDPINRILTGDATVIADVRPDTVVGILVNELVPATVALEAFGALDDLYARVATGVGSAPWGAVSVSVPPDNMPTVVPLRVVFELRPVVDATFTELGVPAGKRHVPCAIALASAIKQVQGAIDTNVAVRLALEVAFGMAKMVPMSRRAFAGAQSGSEPQP